MARLYAIGSRKVVSALSNLPMERWRVSLTAEGLGLLRKDLMSALGVDGARNFLTRFGWNCGFQDAMTIKDLFPQIDPQDWYGCGARLHSMSGIVQVRMDVSRYDPGNQTCYFEGEWISSLEAEQHLRILGRSEEVVCWTLAGYASGYKSAVLGRDVLCREVQCRGRGDACCRFVGKPATEWGAQADKELEYYQPLRLLEELYGLYRKLDDTHWAQESLRFQKALTRLCMDGAGIEIILARLSEFVGAEVAVLRRDLEVFQHVGSQRSSDIKRWISRCRFDFGTRDIRESVIFEPWKKGGLYSLIAPVRMGSELRGWLVLLRTSPFRESDKQICEQAALTCYMLMTQDAAQVVDCSNRSELLERLLFGQGNEVEAKEILLRLGLSETQGYAVGVIEGCKVEASVNDLSDILETSLDLRTVKEGSCYVILSEAQIERVKKMRKKIDALLRERQAYFSLGPLVHQSESLQDSLRQATRTNGILKMFSPEGGLLTYDEVQDYQLLVDRSNHRGRLLEAALAPIVMYERGRDADLLRTLEVYLSTGSISQTAKVCSLHPSGVKYRLRRIETLLGISLRDRRARFDLHLALLIHRMS